MTDIVLTIIDSSDEAGYLPDLEAAGYVLQFREPDWYEHRFLRDRDPDVRVHVFTVGSLEVGRMLLFRDRLRTRSEERELYERTKRELAARRWDYIQDYADAKSAVIEEIIRAFRPPRIFLNGDGGDGFADRLRCRRAGNLVVRLRREQIESKLKR